MKKTILSAIAYFAIVLPTAAQTTVPDADFSSDPLPVVLTPTRLRQSLADVPASVTVITSAMLKDFAVRSLTDALRLVPGMIVDQVTGSDYRIGYHGGGNSTPRRLNVMVDGLSLYRPAFARVDWAEIPVAIEDIDRIEITRGPDSATYGANSMMAIINIITKHPHDTEGAHLQLHGGSVGTIEATARYSGDLNPSTSYRLTVQHHEDGGFDWASSRGLGRDDNRQNSIALRTTTEIDNRGTLDIAAGVLQNVREVELADGFQKTPPNIDSKNYYLNARWKQDLSDRNSLQLQAYAIHHSHDETWNSCPPTAMLLPEMFALYQANPVYARTILAGRIPSGGTSQDNALAATALAAIGRIGITRARAPTCVDVNQNSNETRYDVEVQDTFVLSPALRMVGGLGIRYDRGESETLLANGPQTNTASRVFGNLEYKPTANININAGGFYERDRLSDPTFSPRLALNFHVNNFHTVRMIVSKAVRTPDIYEQRSNQIYQTTNWNPPLNGVTAGRFYQSAHAPGNLQSEQILSRELGYLGNFPGLGLVVDVKAFDDKLTDLISEKLQLSDFHPTNDNSNHLRGGELQLTYQPNEHWRAHLTYAYLDQDTTNTFERTLYARHSGALAIAYTTRDQWSIALVTSAYSGNSDGLSHFGREDITVSKTFRLGPRTRLDAALTFRHLSNLSSTYLVDINSLRESRYNQSMQYFFTAGITF